jgi:hypothetical protein
VFHLGLERLKLLLRQIHRGGRSRGKRQRCHHSSHRTSDGSVLPLTRRAATTRKITKARWNGGGGGGLPVLCGLLKKSTPILATTEVQKLKSLDVYFSNAYSIYPASAGPGF